MDELYSQKQLDEFLEVPTQWNKHHKEYLEESKNAGCYYCCKIFPANTITEWCISTRTPEQHKNKEELPLDCAICPNCGIDAVLPDLKVVLSVPFLREMQVYWFGDDEVERRDFANGEGCGPTFYKSGYLDAESKDKLDDLLGLPTGKT